MLGLASRDSKVENSFASFAWLKLNSIFGFASTLLKLTKTVNFLIVINIYEIGKKLYVISSQSPGNKISNLRILDSL